MPLPTTVIGAFPKPDFLPVPNWFSTSKDDRSVGRVIKNYSQYVQHKVPEATYTAAIKDVLDTQASLGIDVVTDGEIRRENYVHYFCRRIKGIDFDNLSEKICRNGAWRDELPTIVGDVEPLDPLPWMQKEWRIAEELSNRPVKITLPGPMTITDSTVDSFYNDKAVLGRKLAKIVNREIQALVAAGCKHIQVDEPTMARCTGEALDHGIDNAAACFEGVPDDVQKCLHVCCGYPFYMDDMDYVKADNEAYAVLAEKLDRAGLDQISLEDAHCHNDLKLFEKFKKTKIVLGVVQSARSRVESVAEIQQRLREVLTIVSPDRLIVAPDCGLGFLPLELAKQKLANMVEAAKSLP